MAYDKQWLLARCSTIVARQNSALAYSDLGQEYETHPRRQSEASVPRFVQVEFFSLLLYDLNVATHTIAVNVELLITRYRLQWNFTKKQDPP